MPRRSVVLAAVLSAAVSGASVGRAAGGTQLGPKEILALRSMLDAVDAVQRGDVPADSGVVWDSHVLKSANHLAYIPFQIDLAALNDPFKAGAMYIRAVTRPASGAPGVEQHSEVRAMLDAGTPKHPPLQLVYTPDALDLPIAGVTAGTNQAEPASRSAALTLQMRDYEKQMKAHGQAQQPGPRDPSLFPFENFSFFDARSSGGRIGRALTLPAGEYDLYVALLDRDRLKKGGTPAVLARRVIVPDYWSGDLRLSSLILTGGVRRLNAPLAAKAQADRPYTFGVTDVQPSPAEAFGPGDLLSVVFQVCNFASPDADLAIDYRFFRMDGGRRYFNGTPTQEYEDKDLTAQTTPWESQAFVMQSVPLATFAPGRYELEVTVHDRLTRSNATAAADFTVQQ